MRTLIPASLAGRFALASAGLAAAAVLLVSLASWWLIDRQQAQAEQQMAVRAREFHARNVASTLRALANRMAEVAGSSILATGLVDSAGKETYLTPFLNGVRQVNGIPVQVLFTDYEGKEIAGNASARFAPAELQWLRTQLAAGQPAANVLQTAQGAQLIALEPLRYSRTTTPEGALLYKMALGDIHLDPGMQLRWGGAGAERAATPVETPAVYAPLGFRIVGTAEIPPHARLAPQYLVILVLALAVFAAVFLAGARLARRLTRDLSRLEAFSSNVVSAGSGDQRAPAGGSSEVASLSVSINRMLERLHEQHEALKQEGDKLARAAEALTTADRRKDEFLAMLAHELRNPLAPISTGAELLRLASGGDERVRRTSDVIARQVRHMSKIVDDLLDVSRVTRGLVTLEKLPVDLHGVLQQALDQIRPFAQARGHTLVQRIAREPLMVVGDASRLVQVASNLLHNACKYTPDGGRIELAASVEDDAVVLRVADNGSGIAPEFLPEIFGLFVQGSRLPDRAQGGLGLGLPLVKHLVELHGGSVVAHSPGLGQGTTLTVRLPRAHVAPAATPAPETPVAADTATGALRILLVDDNVDAAETLAALLQMEGHAVQLAFDGPGALERAAGLAVDVFILDIGLPGMDGNAVARRLREMPQHRAAVLIALTGYGQAGDRARSADAGFDHHLVKPVDPDALKALLAELAAAAATPAGG